MGDSNSIHVPVLPDEVLEWLRPQPGACIVDGTFGGGGHARMLAKCVGEEGVVLGLDRDPAVIERAESELRGWPIKVANANFCDLPEVLEEAGIERVDGILLDLGLSSDQLADRDRGFGYDTAGALDLRFNSEVGDPAWKLLDRMTEKHIADVIYQYGEERCSRRIARRIVERRRSDPIRTARQLSELVRGCVPRSKNHRIDPATRTFQALRIAVNDELGALQSALKRIPDCLAPGGRVAIISFHSLEDRIVKQAYRGDDRYVILTKKPIQPNESEITRNPRSRSAKMRVAECAV